MKYSRHAIIHEIIKNHIVETQEELVALLKSNGFNVTQATVSRDIKELRLIKVLSKKGKYKYASIKEQNTIITDRFIKIFKDSFLKIDYAGNLIVIKTLPGAAQAAGAALDAMDKDEIVGTLAGDDTIFLAIRNTKDIEPLMDAFVALTK